MKAVLIPVTPAELHARRNHALTSVRLTEAGSPARVETGDPAPDEWGAWFEVDEAVFPLAGPR